MNQGDQGGQVTNRQCVMPDVPSHAAASKPVACLSLLLHHIGRYFGTYQMGLPQ